MDFSPDVLLLLLVGGQTLIRWVVIAMCVALCAKLLFDVFATGPAP